MVDENRGNSGGLFGGISPSAGPSNENRGDAGGLFGGISPSAGPNSENRGNSGGLFGGLYYSASNALTGSDSTSSKPPASPASPTSTATVAGAMGSSLLTSAGGITPRVVPGVANPADPSQINVTDWASQVAVDPSLAMTSGKNGTYMSDRVGDMSASQVSGGLLGDTGSFTSPSANAEEALKNLEANQGGYIDPKDAEAYQAYRISPDTPQMNAARGVVNNAATIDPADFESDIGSIASGNSPIGTSFTNNAQQHFGIMSTKKADELGLNSQQYVDKKATVAGQMEILQRQFVGSDGQPTIPVWASGAARNVSKIATFSGMTGTAATAAMSQAIMEASLPIATQDAQFFQTLTVKNLDNRQQATINNANILARLQEQNVDSRTAAAIQTSKNFLEMDLANLSNEQQANVINLQSRMQTLLEDGKQENAARLFAADSQNEMNQFYDNLAQDMAKFNTSQANEVNVARTNMQVQQDQFYSNMRYNVSLSNARWRQQVAITDKQREFEAAAMDTQAMLGIQSSQLAEIWDRSDAILDYVWKSGENEADRTRDLALQQLANDNALNLQSIKSSNESSQALGGVFGNLAGIAAESFFSGFDWGGLF